MSDKSYEYDAADRIEEKLDAANRLTTYAFDATEQTPKKVHDGPSDTEPVLEAKDLSYDLRGRMSQVAAAVTADYVYNPDGIRVTKSIAGSGNGHYVIASHNPIGYAQVLEEHVGASIDRAYTIGHTVLGQDDGTDDLTFLVDGHNSTMALVKEDGQPDQRFAYDAYGNLLEGDGLTSAAAAKTNHLYTSEHFDADAQMQYLRARWYDPTNGRFNRLDPFAGNVQDPQSLHKYLYVHANPVMNVDPAGLFTIAGVAVTAGLIGAAAGAAIGGYIGVKQTGTLFSVATWG